MGTSQDIFRAEEDYTFYLEKADEAANKHECNIHAYVLMTNHVHLLVTPHLEYKRLSKTDTERQANYRQLFQAQIPDRTVVEIRQAINQSNVLGSDNYIQRIAKKLNRPAKTGAHGGDRKSVNYHGV